MSVVPQLPATGVDDSRIGPDRADAGPGCAGVDGAGNGCAGHVRVEGEPDHRLVFCDGAVVDVLASYPVRQEADLFSLARALTFHCADCRGRCEATIVAVRDQGLLCPACYAALGTVRDSPQPRRDRTLSYTNAEAGTTDAARRPTAA